jgi:hypothetical protein
MSSIVLRKLWFLYSLVDGLGGRAGDSAPAHPAALMTCTYDAGDERSGVGLGARPIQRDFGGTDGSSRASELIPSSRLAVGPIRRRCRTIHHRKLQQHLGCFDGKSNAGHYGLIEQTAGSPTSNSGSFNDARIRPRRITQRERATMTGLGHALAPTGVPLSDGNVLSLVDAQLSILSLA